MGVEYNHSIIDSSTWWLKETKGATLFNKFILSSIKVIYLGSRFLLKLALGKKRRDRIYVQKGINFKDFLYKSLKFLGMYNFALVEIYVSKYNYKACCRLNKEDIIASTIHEDLMLDYFTPKQGDVVVDLGANIGRYAIIASRRVGTNGKVIAIEAHPRNCEIINRNIKLNGLNNVIALNYAAYSKETKLRLYTPDEELGYTMHHSIMFNYLSPRFNMEKEEGKYVEVNANTLDNLLEQNGIRPENVNWIKIDVEGAEYEVLRGAHNVLSNSNDLTLIIEVHGSNNNNKYKSIIELLDLYHFKIKFEKTYVGGDVYKHVILRK